MSRYVRTPRGIAWAGSQVVLGAFVLTITARESWWWLFAVELGYVSWLVVSLGLARWRPSSRVIMPAPDGISRGGAGERGPA